MTYQVDIFSLPLLLVNAGVHRNNSIQQSATGHDHLIHTARQTPTTAGKPKRYRKLVEINPAVLG